MPLFSIIIPTFNRSDLIVEALNSVRRQRFWDYELIVVDDGSTDQTPRVLERCADGWPDAPLRIFRQENAGQGAARNLGIRHANGEYCVFVDSDDLLFPWSLDKIAQAIAGAKSPPLVLGALFPFRDLKEYVAASDAPLRCMAWPNLLSCSRDNLFLGAGETIARTCLLREMGGFMTERVTGEDTDLLLRCGAVTPIVRIEAPATYAYRMHSQMCTRGASGYLGASTLIARYRAGVYPGGRAHRREIEQMLAWIADHHGLRYLGAGDWRKYLSLSLMTFSWNLRPGRYGRLCKMPLRVCLGMLGLWPIHPGHRRAVRREMGLGHATDSAGV